MQWISTSRSSIVVVLASKSTLASTYPDLTHDIFALIVRDASDVTLRTERDDDWLKSQSMGRQAGPSRAGAQFAAHGHCQRNYSC